MKKLYIIKKTLWLITVIALFIQCGDSDLWKILSESEVKVKNITINPTEDISLIVGKTTTFTATVSPENATNKNIIWSSLHSNIATVDSQTGVVTGISKGVATIQATATDGSGVSANKSITITFTEPEMIFVQGGTFTMGCTTEQGYDCWGNETPNHSVTLSSFYIGKFEITQKEWTTIMGNNPSYFGGDNLPVERISWNDIVGTSGNSEEINGIMYYSNGFIYKLNSATGKKYRLPTEAEWEYAARGGNKSMGYKYSGSNTVDDVAWCNGNSGGTTHPVGTKQSNELGIYDMSGNVWECCSDWYGRYSSSSQTNPTGPSSGSSRVTRGGGWNTIAVFVRVSDRTYECTPGLIYEGLGFRVALSSE